MSLNNQFSSVTSGELKRMKLRNTIRNFDWEEIQSEPQMFQTIQNLNPIQRAIVNDVYDGAIKKTERREGEFTFKQYKLVLDVEQLVAYGDVVDFQKIKRLEIEPSEQAILHFEPHAELHNVA